MTLVLPDLSDSSAGTPISVDAVTAALGPRRPNGLRVLDLCCGAGGAAMGYYMAGFEVVGVDSRPQPQYPFRFIQADALAVPLDGFDLVHASWPCQTFARVTAWRGDRADHPDLLTPGRRRLQDAGVAWVIENVPEAPLRPDYVLCGTQFGLNVRRHRVFETSWGTSGDLVPPCAHHPGLLAFAHKGERAYADAMGCTWMSSKTARQAIPPAYTHHIATQFLQHAHRAAGRAGCNETPCHAPGCSRPIRQRATGRPRRFCSGACRVRHHRTGRGHPIAS